MIHLTLTEHAKTRMQERIITLQDVYTCVKQGITSEAKNGLVRYTNGNIYVILNNDTKTVVTVCFTKSYTKQLEKYAKQNNIGFYRAVKELRRNSIAC